MLLLQAGDAEYERSLMLCDDTEKYALLVSEDILTSKRGTSDPAVQEYGQ